MSTPTDLPSDAGAEQPPEDSAELSANQLTSVDEARQRLRRALVQPGRGQLVVAVLVAILGFAGVTQVRLAGEDDAYAGLRQSDLIQALNGLQASSRRAELEIAELEETRRALLSSRDKTAAALLQSRNELAILGILAGTLPAEGPGIRITVTIPEGRISLNYLLDGIEELRDAGAEAIEISDRVRVVAQTSFETAPNGIAVDGTVLSSPFTIDAIGDPEGLKTAMNFFGGFVDDIELDQGRVTITTAQTITIDQTREPVSPRFAQTDDEDR